MNNILIKLDKEYIQGEITVPGGVEIEATPKLVSQFNLLAMFESGIDSFDIKDYSGEWFRTDTDANKSRAVLIFDKIREFQL